MVAEEEGEDGECIFVGGTESHQSVPDTWHLQALGSGHLRERFAWIEIEHDIQHS